MTVFWQMSANFTIIWFSRLVTGIAWTRQFWWVRLGKGNRILFSKQSRQL